MASRNFIISFFYIESRITDLSVLRKPRDRVPIFQVGPGSQASLLFLSRHFSSWIFWLLTWEVALKFPLLLLLQVQGSPASAPRQTSSQHPAFCSASLETRDRQLSRSPGPRIIFFKKEPHSNAEIYIDIERRREVILLPSEGNKGGRILGHFLPPNQEMKRTPMGDSHNHPPTPHTHTQRRDPIRLEPDCS